MKILIENGGYRITNMGDLAMLQVAISRLKGLWPGALIEVFTSNPGLLTKFCPEVRPLVLAGSFKWFPSLLVRLHRLMPSSAAQQHLSKFEWKLHRYLPSLTRPILQRKLKKISMNNSSFNSLVRAVEAADLVVASGGGYITDSFHDKAARTLEILNLATWLDRPTVILGQGLGPLQNLELSTKAKVVLPRVDLISLRENRAGMPLLDSLGVSRTRVTTTGDDAIELAYQARSRECGDGLGVNLRVTGYSSVDTDALEIVRSALQHIAREKSVPLIPVPIANYKTEDDPKAIQKLLAGYDNDSDGGQDLDTPLKVIEQVGRCRVVVTGSYHAGVFALAQGIPVVGLAKSKYYVDKLLGLAEQFGTGCEIISLDDEQLLEKLIFAINNAWILAEEVRAQLLESAGQQVELGRAAYQQVYKLVESRRAVSSNFP